MGSGTLAGLITASNITFLLGIIGVIITVYRAITNPQITSDKQILLLSDRISNVENAVKDIKENHLRSVEQDIKNLTSSVNTLSTTVVKLATIIDERIPRNNQ